MERADLTLEIEGSRVIAARLSARDSSRTFYVVQALGRVKSRPVIHIQRGFIGRGDQILARYRNGKET